MKKTWKKLLAWVLVMACVISTPGASLIAYAIDDAPEAELTAVSSELPEKPDTETVRVIFLRSPENAVVVVYDGENVVTPEADGSYLLAPGRYTYSASADGYQPVEKAELALLAGRAELLVALTLNPVEEEAEEPEEPAEEPEEPAEEPAEEPEEPEKREEIEEPEETEKPGEIEAEAKVPLADTVNGTPQTVTATITAGKSYTANITTEGGYVYYKFVPTVTAPYVFTSNAEKDTYGYLYDSNWDLIESDDDSGGNGNFKISEKLTANTTYYFGVRFYSSSNTGSIPVSLTQVKTGWNQVGDDYYYYDSDGNAYRSNVYLINGSYYGFDYDGLMYNNVSFSSSNQYVSGNYGYHRAKEGGALYVNSWYQDTDSGYWYYYGNYGMAPQGRSTVGGKQYYFYSDGRMAANCVVSIDNSAYFADANGVLTKAAEGWNDVGGNYYYVKNGELYKDGVYAINGSYYGFDYYGQMYANTSFDVYDDDLSRWVYYRAKSDGKLYVNSWYQEDSSWYYYGAGGKAPSGLTTVGSKQYYFSSTGRMVTNTSVTVDGKNYRIDENGVVTELKEGWNQFGDNWYYVKNGELCKNGVFAINGSYYGFDYYGCMYSDTEFDVYDEDLSRWVYYRAKSDGKLYVNAWYQDEYGDWYYYGAGGKAPSGLDTVGSKQYFFFSDGRMVTNQVVSDENGAYYTDDSGALTRLSPGWNQINGYYYYVKDGTLFKNGVYKINSSYYGFNSEGRMFDDTSFGSYYNNEVDKYGYHRARSGGALYVNQWVQANGSWYYYGDAGLAPSGLTTVSGKQYYFYSNGRMATDCIVSADGKAYVADSAGALSAAKEGWNSVDGAYYYVSNGSLYTSGVYKIGSNYYGFNSEGRMFDDTYFGSYYNQEAGKSGYHRAKAGGALYVNAWVQDGNGDWYYYGAAGLAPSGLTTVGGKQYYFRYNGRMAVNCVVSTGSKAYVADANGALSAAKEGWNSVGGYYYYVKNGSVYSGRVYKIGSSYYGFDSDGRMFDDRSFGEYYNTETQSYGYHRAKKGGALYVKEWAQVNGSWYYYGEAGMAAQGLTTIGGKQYYFNYNGMMYVNRLFSYDNKAYAAGSDGIVTAAKEGWTSLGGEYYYVKDGKLYTNGVYAIGGSYYGFDWDGTMYNDETFEAYDENDHWYCYRAKAGGKLYVSAWVQDDGDWYYYGADGKAPQGLTTIGGKQYYFFDWGYIAVNRAVSANGKNYYADDSGALSALSNGWNSKGGGYYYVKNGVLYKDGVYQIDGAYYGFDYGGRMYDDTSFSIWDDDNDTRFYYQAKAGGKLYVNAWVETDWGWYYYGAGGKAPQGLTTVDGKQYFFDYDGEMLVNEYVCIGGYLYHTNASGIAGKVTSDGLYKSTRSGSNGGAVYGIFYVSGGKVLKNSWKTVSGSYYYFSSDGHAYRGTIATISGKHYYFNDDGVMESGGWVFSYSAKYYAASSGALLTGEQKIGDKWYYFDTDGRLMTGLVSYKGKLYLCGSDGAYIGAAQGNGWNQIKGSWYYVENGQPVAGLKTIDGVVYAFNYNGLMLTDTTYDRYVFNSSGKQVTSGWYLLNGKYLYINSSTKEYVTGFQTIGGKQYYFGSEGLMVTGEKFINGKKYVFSDSGAQQSVTDVKNGWYLIDGTYYYYENGVGYNGWKGDYYIESGYMRTNSIVDDYWVGRDGKWVKSGWIKYSTYNYDSSGNYYGAYLYAKSGGKLAKSEWVTVSGSSYYFGENYRMVTGIYAIGGKVYQFSDTGALIKTLSTSVTNGWLAVGSDYAYIRGGQVLRNTVTTIGSATYAFNSTGLMVKNGTWYGYDDIGRYGMRYFGSDGKMANYTGWQTIGSAKFYFDQDHMAKEGLFNLDGKTYYCNTRTMSGWYAVNGRLLQFDSNGALIAEDTTQNGWVQKGSYKFYVKNGRVYSGGIYTIDGKTYGFDYNGHLVANSVVYFESYYDQSAIYFCGSDGTVSASAGWKTDRYGYQYYTDGTGRCLTGIRNIGGKTYFFNEDGEWLR